MTILGVAFLGATAFSLLFRRSWFPWLLSAAAAFPTSAAVTLAGNALNPFYMLAIIAVLWLAFVPRARVTGPGKNALTLFALWTATITAIGPVLFSGMKVLSPRDGIEGGLRSPADLSFSVSHLAQIVYLLLAIGVVYFVVKRGASPHLPAAAFGTGTLLATINLICIRAGMPWPSELFETSFVTYQSGLFDGSIRLRGAFAEPSLLAEFTVAGFAFFFFMMVACEGRQRFWYLVFSVLALVNLAASSTGTGTLAAVAIIALIFLHFVLRSGRKNVPVVLTFVVLFGALAAVFYGQQVAEWVASVIEEKIGSVSQISRFAADQMALDIFNQSVWLGVGLGSNRPSSFLTMLLSCVGVIGFVAFAVFAVKLLKAAQAHSFAKPAAWGLLAGLIAKAVAVPDVSSPYMWVLIASCAGSVWVSQHKKRKPDQGHYFTTVNGKLHRVQNKDAADALRLAALKQTRTAGPRES